MSAIPEMALETRERELGLVCEWVAGAGVAEGGWAAGDSLELALRHSEDPELLARIEERFYMAAAAGGSLRDLMDSVSGRIIDAFEHWSERAGGSAPSLDSVLKLQRFQAGAVKAVVRAFERGPAQSAGPPDGVRRSSVEAILDAIKRINNAANSSLDLRQTTELSVRAITEVMGLDECSVFIHDEGSNRLVLHATHGMNPDLLDKASLAVGEGITGAAAVSGKPIAVRDAWSDPRFSYIPNLYEEEYRSILVVPIVLFTVNRLMGVLSMHSREYRDFTAEEIEFVETAAGQLAMAMWNARVYEQTDAELRRRVKELSTLQRIGQTITSSLDYREVLDTIVHRAAEIIDADKAAIFELGEETQTLFIVASHRLSPEYTKLKLAVGEGVVGTVVKTREAVMVEDALNDPRLVVSRELLHQEGYRSLFCVPLVAKNRVLGAVSVYKLAHHRFTQDEIRLVQAFADQAAIAMENARLYQETRAGMQRNALLLRELQHRVKNNLQTVASLLTMQARHARSKEAAELLGHSAGRIAGMVAVHDLLSGRNFSVTTVLEVVQAIVETARADAAAYGTKIAFSAQGEAVEISSDKAMVIAMVVNELIWNAITHGFERQKQGSIGITVARRDGSVLVTVRDDGRGLPLGFDLRQDAGLGLDIIRQLVSTDLAGEFGIRSDHGTTATVEFTA